MAQARASRELLAPKDDVWKLVAEPYHLPDWCPAYTGVEPDRRGLAENARWKVVRAPRPGIVRRGGREGTLVVTRVVAGEEVRWLDGDEALEIRVVLTRTGESSTDAAISVRGAWWRLHLDGARRLPRAAAARLHALCQTAASL